MKCLCMWKGDHKGYATLLYVILHFPLLDSIFPASQKKKENKPKTKTQGHINIYLYCGTLFFK